MRWDVLLVATRCKTVEYSYWRGGPEPKRCENVDNEKMSIDKLKTERVCFGELLNEEEKVVI